MVGGGGGGGSGYKPAHDSVCSHEDIGKKTAVPHCIFISCFWLGVPFVPNSIFALVTLKPFDHVRKETAVGGLYFFILQLVYRCTSTQLQETHSNH